MTRQGSEERARRSEEVEWRDDSAPPQRIVVRRIDDWPAYSSEQPAVDWDRRAGQADLTAETSECLVCGSARFSTIL